MYEIFSNICLILMILLVIYTIYKIISKKENSAHKITGFIDKHYKICLILIFIVFAFTRVYDLENMPNTLNIDEASLAYNAFSIDEYGTDRYANIFPIYFLNYVNGQSALYTYLAALMIKIFGYSLLVVRVPAVIFSLITLIFGYLLGKELKGKSFGLLVASIITICPFFFMSSRWALDCNLMLGMFAASAFALLKAIKSEKTSLFIISGLLFGLTLYTYALSYLMIPVILLFILIYLIYIKKINIKNFFSFCIPLGILALPLIIQVAVQAGFIGEIKTNYFSIVSMTAGRIGEVSIFNIWDNLTSIGNYFVFDTVVSSKSVFGTMYLFSIPLILFGIIITFYKGFKGIKNKEFNLYTYFSLIFLGFFISLLLVKSSTIIIWRGNAMFMFLAIFLALGIWYVSNKIKYSWIIISIIYLIAFSYFTYDYFKLLPVRYYNSSEPMTDYMLALEDAKKIDKDIYTVKLDEFNYTNLWAALALKTSPYKYEERAEGFDKINFNIPDKYEEDAVYLVFEDKVKDLENKKFKCKNYNKINMCFKEVKNARKN